jgi:hypothetical protein
MPVAISLLNLVPDHQRNLLTKISLRIADKILGIHHLDKLYKQHQLLGLADFLAKIPKTGQVIITSNHSFGGIEDVIFT